MTPTLCGCLRDKASPLQKEKRMTLSPSPSTQDPTTVLRHEIQRLAKALEAIAPIIKTSPQVTHLATCREALARLQQVVSDEPLGGLRRTTGTDAEHAPIV